VLSNCETLWISCLKNYQQTSLIFDRIPICPKNYQQMSLIFGRILSVSQNNKN